MRLTRVSIVVKIRHPENVPKEANIYARIVIHYAAIRALFCFLPSGCVYINFHWTRSAVRTMTIRYIFIECFYRCPLFTHDSFLSAMISCRNVYAAAIHTHILNPFMCLLLPWEFGCVARAEREGYLTDAEREKSCDL